MAFYLKLLILFQVKHLLADFLFQNQYMVAGKNRPAWSFLAPLSLHSLIHSAMTFGVLLVMTSDKFYWLALLDFIVHFAIDRLKSHPLLGGRLTMADNPQMFWFLFGLDQFLHQMTYLFFLVLIANH